MNDKLENEVVRLLTERKLTIATGESCTGGLIANRITNVAGSSACLLGGLIAYSNQVKERIASVSGETLSQYGAVSAEVARELARGVRSMFAADVAVSVTGIAGPGGSTPGKPVGLTYIGICAEGYEQVAKHIWQSDRIGNKQRSADAALGMVLHYLGARMSMGNNDTDVATDVEASLAADGQVTARAFTWQGRRLVVTSSGRQWQEADRRHLLVQTSSGETLELAIAMPEMRWTARLVGQRSLLA
jgi:PncC family amidohydrolase